MLKDAKIFETDETIQKKYEATKPFFDRLHREFVKEALQDTDLVGFDEYLGIFRKWKIDKKAVEKDLQKKEGELRKSVVDLFNKKAEAWSFKYKGLKNKNLKIFDEEAVFESVLKMRYGDEKKIKILSDATGEMVSIFDSWKGFTGYFRKFFETRRNFYKEDGTSTAIATRIVDQNLRRFCDNILNFEKIKNKINLTEVEENTKESLSEVFTPEFYSKCLLQDGIDYYNKILGGDPKDQDKRGLNQLINEYRQQKGDKLQLLKSLDKQILSEKEKILKDEIKNNQELLDVLKSFYETANKKIKIFEILFRDFIDNNTNYNLEEVYISREAYNTISHKWTNETEVFDNNLFEALKNEKIVSGTNTKRKDTGYSFPDFITLGNIKKTLDLIKIEKFWKEKYYEISDFGEKHMWEQFLSIFDFEFASLLEKEIIEPESGKKLKVGYKCFSRDFERLLQGIDVDRISSGNKVAIKNFADSVLTIYQMAKYFAIEKKKKWLGDDYNLGEFYQNPEFGYKEKFYNGTYEDIVLVYDKLRNYLTKKPYSEKKWKLNFGNPTLADGWDKNKEKDNFAVILRQDNKYYLGLMTKENSKAFDDCFIEEFRSGLKNGKYEKMVYKYFPDQAKMFPKVCFSAKGLDYFKPSEEIRSIYKNSEFKKGNSFSIKSMHKMIDFYKDCLTRYEGWKGYHFKHIKPTEEYQKNIGEFFRDVAKDGYKITFQDISESYINKKNMTGKLYLFQIKNKDWNCGAKKVKNLHTLYFESLFSKENIAQNFLVKLNGQAEIFYRPRTKDLEKKDIVTKGKGNVIDECNHKEGRAYQKNRFTDDKIFFHVPVTLNRVSKNTNQYQFNSEINSIINGNSNINIIGVDRGEKHLAYYSVINQKGEILDSGSLNFVGKDGSGKPIDYHKKLGEKAKNREQSRRDWQEIEAIKDLKKGYISQVVRKLADLIIKYNAIIVFEDLNMRFKQIRGGIEKSTYQQLEKALIGKLNYLVKKDEKDPEEIGHPLKAYQLSAPFTSFKEMGKQTGIIFYTQANYTSKIDPVTGWRPNLYLKYKNAGQAKKDIIKFSKIEFCNGRFEFTYDLRSFLTENDKPKFSRKAEWKVCSNVERFYWNRKLNNNKGGYKRYKDLTGEFEKLFEKFDIDVKKNILDQIIRIDTEGNETFFNDFIFLFKLVCQIRNTDEKARDVDKQDFILSPVKPFFDSRKSDKFGKNFPKNGDANGAYNIARKGIIMNEHIKQWKKDGSKKYKQGSDLDLLISDQEWDLWLCDRVEWNKKLRYFASRGAKEKSS